jgi:hypothetical protein
MVCIKRRYQTCLISAHKVRYVVVSSVEVVSQIRLLLTDTIRITNLVKQ